MITRDSSTDMEPWLIATSNFHFIQTLRFITVHWFAHKPKFMNIIHFTTKNIHQNVHYVAKNFSFLSIKATKEEVCMQFRYLVAICAYNLRLPIFAAWNLLSQSRQRQGQQNSRKRRGHDHCGYENLLSVHFWRRSKSAKLINFYRHDYDMIRLWYHNHQLNNYKC